MIDVEFGSRYYLTATGQSLQKDVELTKLTRQPDYVLWDSNRKDKKRDTTPENVDMYLSLKLRVEKLIFERWQEYEHSPWKGYTT